MSGYSFFAQQAVACAIVLSAIAGLCLVATRSANSGRIDRLEKREAAIQNRLGRIASFSVQQGRGSVGYRGWTYKSPEQKDSNNVDWGKAQGIDEIVLVPVIHGSGTTHLESFGLPVEFSVSCGLEGEPEGRKMTSFTGEHLPRIALLVILCPPGNPGILGSHRRHGPKPGSPAGAVYAEVVGGSVFQRQAQYRIAWPC